MVTAHDALLQEFRSHYLADELPLHIGAVLPGMASASAMRLRQRVPEADVPALINLLRRMSHDPDDPMVRVVEEETSIEWTDHPEQWQELSQLLAYMAAELTRLSAPVLA